MAVHDFGIDNCPILLTVRYLLWLWMDVYWVFTPQKLSSYEENTCWYMLSQFTVVDDNGAIVFVSPCLDLPHARQSTTRSTTHAPAAGLFLRTSHSLAILRVSSDVQSLRGVAAAVVLCPFQQITIDRCNSS
jgi:hypothetical protein